MCCDGGKLEIFRTLQQHLAVTSRAHGVFKGVMKGRKIPKQCNRQVVKCRRVQPKSFLSQSAALCGRGVD